MMKMFLALLLTCLVATTQSTETVRMSFGQRGLEFAEGVAVYMTDIIRDIILNVIDIPEMHVNGATLSNLQIHQMDIPRPQLTIVPNIGIKMKSDGLSVELTGNWGYSIFFGQLSLSASVVVEATAGINADMGNKKFVTEYRGCSVDFYSFNLDFHHFVANAIVNQEDVKNELRMVVCEEVKAALDNTVNGAVNSVPKTLDIPDLPDIIFAPDRNPVFKSSHLDLPSRVSAVSASAFPFTADGITDEMDTSYMGCFILSDYTINTATYVALPKNKINIKLPNDDFSTNSALLNSAYFKDSLPQLYNTYPNSAITYRIWNLDYPNVEFDKDLIMVEVPLRISIKVGGAVILSVKMQLKTKGSVSIDGAHLFGAVDSIKHTTTVVTSEIGAVSDSTANSVMDSVLKKTIIPDLNAELKAGFTLPIDEWVDLNKALVQTHDDFLKVCADFSLTEYALKTLRDIVEKEVAAFQF